ncbi:MAG: redoxin domain-containing protein [Chloroflexota bacterium]
MDSLARVGAPAPDFILPDLNGTPHQLSEGRGRVVVLNFWSAECPWSTRADEAIQRLAPTWGGQVRVWRLASNANEGLEQLRQVASDRGLPLVLREEQRLVADQYGAQVTPHLFVIDADDVIRYSGAPDDATFRQRRPTRNYLGQAVAAVLAGQAAQPAETPAYGCALVRLV